MTFWEIPFSRAQPGHLLSPSKRTPGPYKAKTLYLFSWVVPEKPLCLAVLPLLGTVCGSAACGERQSAVVITHPLQALPPAKPEIAGRRVVGGGNSGLSVGFIRGDHVDSSVTGRLKLWAWLGGWFSEWWCPCCSRLLLSCHSTAHAARALLLLCGTQGGWPEL